MRDVSKILSDAETLKLRALLAQTPDISPDDNLGKEYPKMLFHPNYIELYRLVKSHPDPLVKKEAQQKMPSVLIIVHDIETEEDYTQDGWRSDPNDFITMSIEEGGLGEPNPRIPTGREGRRSAKMNKLTREAEIRDLRRRYAELTGKKLADDDMVAAPAASVAPPPTPPTTERPKAAKPPQAAPAPANKRERVQQAAQRATRPGHHASA